MFKKRGLGLAMVAIGTALVALYFKVVRPWTMRWGATDKEVARWIPGDDLVRRADFNATRAVTIHARPEHVWPWLVQIGSGRAGWYSYDWIDNTGVPSAMAIIPELQHMEVGDLVPMVVGKEIGPWVKELEPNRRMLWWDREGEFTWEWLLEPSGDDGTRLVNRIRETAHPWTPRMLYEIVAASGDIVMTRKCLLGPSSSPRRTGSSARVRPRQEGE